MSADYILQHTTRFTYSNPVSESVMEARLQPATEGPQRCLEFELAVEPHARLFSYRDALGNRVHHFDLPRPHGELTLTARSHVQLDAPAPPPAALPFEAWNAIDDSAAQGEHWDFLQPSHFVVSSGPIVEFANSLDFLERGALDPLTAVREIAAAVHRSFEYAPNSTRVDSPIDDALATRRGVCQDFAHVMLALLRRLRLPSRYVSGYIAPPAGMDAGGGGATIATHAWVEVLLPELGWVGFDPTNNIEAGVRHVRVAIGRDYADVPPTRGVFKGHASSTLAVSVEFISANDLTERAAAADRAWLMTTAPSAGVESPAQDQQQQQQ